MTRQNRNMETEMLTTSTNTTSSGRAHMSAPMSNEESRLAAAIGRILVARRASEERERPQPAQAGEAQVEWALRMM